WRTRARGNGRSRTPSRKTCLLPPARSRSSGACAPARAIPSPTGCWPPSATPSAAIPRARAAPAGPEPSMPSDEPFALIIFGASGNLTSGKLDPALWSLFQGRVLPEPFVILGVARSEMSDEDFRRRMREAVGEFALVQPLAAHVWERFASSLFYCPGEPAEAALYARLGARLRQLETDKGTGGNRLFYCSTPPSRS